jgi:methyl acetate hydrolase
MRKIALLATLLAGGGVWAAQGTQPAASPLDALLQAAVRQKRVPMAVAVVADARGVTYEHAVGAPKDAIFAIASMTKPVTSVAVMQLVEAGRVKLDEPAATYVRDLGSVQVLDGGTLRAPKTPVTVRHLLTHTSGFAYEFMNRHIADLVAKGKVPTQMKGGDGFMQAPLVFDPGTRWEYGISTDWLGRLVERVSGQSLEVYFREKIFEPLRMSDTFFNVPAAKRSRVVPVFQRKDDGSLVQPPPRPVEQTEFFSGGGGLHSTARDYIRFTRALLAGGELDSKRILSAASVEMMGRNQIGDLALGPMPSLVPSLATDGAVLPGGLDKFGLGFALNSKTAGTQRGLNTMAWAGILNTYFWIDREKQVTAVLMSQMLPGMDPAAARLLEEFDRVVYERLGRTSTP